jgi:dipeptidase E
MKKNALLLSSSSYKDTGYLVHNKPWIEEFLSELNLLEEEAIFIPYAGVRLSFDEYEKKVQDKLDNLKIKSIHHFEDKKVLLKMQKLLLLAVEILLCY